MLLIVPEIMETNKKEEIKLIGMICPFKKMIFEYFPFLILFYLGSRFIKVYKLISEYYNFRLYLAFK